MSRPRASTSSSSGATCSGGRCRSSASSASRRAAALGRPATASATSCTPPARRPLVRRRSWTRRRARSSRPGSPRSSGRSPAWDAWSSVTRRRGTTRRSSRRSLRTTTSARRCASTDAAVVICGHTHVQFDRSVRRSAAPRQCRQRGAPYEGRPGAFWALLDGGLELRRTEYDVDLALARLERAGFPSFADVFRGRAPWCDDGRGGGGTFREPPWRVATSQRPAGEGSAVARERIGPDRRAARGRARRRDDRAAVLERRSTCSSR